jgi:2-polyprenyl-6-methoxyphenol hydroxylase-like FAD-dependent oxidoreductase
MTLSTTCVIAGGGPAGMMCGYILARAGVDVIVLEKHKDFLRDFRGDTVHPSTLSVMNELGLLDDFLKLPHEQVTKAQAKIGGRYYIVADLSHLPVKCKFVALMPQWDFLNFLADKGKALPHFKVMMEAKATGLLRDDNRVTGVSVSTNEGDTQIAADLVIGADGRHSTLRDASGLRVNDQGAPIDVLWMRIAHHEGDDRAVLGKAESGSFFVMIYRGDYWQCAMVIPKGGFDAIQAQGIEAFRARVAQLAERANADEIKSWDDVKLLTVTVDRLEQWHQPGLLFIGDAAHAMSPVGGVGINLAVQDAVAAANILAAPLRERRVTDADLARVQKRRLWPTKVIQAGQVAVQNRVLKPVLSGKVNVEAPWILKLMQQFPVLQRIPARIIGLGIRPEHVSI